MSHEFLSFIESVLLTKTFQSSDLFNAILKSIFTPSQICDYSIELFLQLNFTGPSDPSIEVKLDISKEYLKYISEELTCEGEIPFGKTKGLVLLWIAKCLSNEMRGTENLKLKYQSCITYMKCIYLHQATLPDIRSISLKNQMLDCFDQAIQCKSNDAEGMIDALDEFQLLILSSHLHLLYYEYQKCDDLFKQCQSLLGMSTELKGALGKRTKFQEDNFSQLYLEITRNKTDSATFIDEIIEKSATKNLPNDQLLDDEVLLDEPIFVDNEKRVRPSLAEQALLVFQSHVHKLSRAKDEATIEECNAILSAAIGNGNGRLSSWCVTSEALLQQCQLGTRTARRTERSLIQFEELSNQFAYSIPCAESRLNWFFLARMPSIWELQLKLARLLSAMGLVKSALDILLPWDQWGAIITCFIQLGQRERAEKLIRERMAADGETAELLCCLGDVTKDRQHYDRAWIVSKKRSARAMSSLAAHYMFVDMNHEQAALCFEESLRINSLQVNTWFTYGCCCLQLLDYRRAVAGFKQCLRLEPDNFEAWNNCASAHVELGERKSALALLKEATKYSYENWRLWDNICMVSAPIGEFITTIKAYNRVIDLKDQHRDPATLSLIVKSIIANTTTPQVRIELKKLFERISRQDGRDPRIWIVYAEFLSSDEQLSDEIKEKVLHCLSRAYHGMCPSGWQNDNAQCKRALMSALQLVDRSIQYNISYTSARLAVKSIQSVLRTFRDGQVEELDNEVKDLLARIDEAAIVMSTIECTTNDCIDK